MIESQQGGLFRSDDGGDTWELVSDNPEIRGRPWYYSHVFADTQDPETVYILEGGAYKSVDGGRNFGPVYMPHGDQHDLWIDPVNPRRMIEGNDGGACVSFNGGETWSSIYNQPTSQFYHVTTDSRFPYRVYGAQQDNTTMSLPSRSYTGAISTADYHSVGGGESGYIAVKPDDPDIVYAGNHSNGYVSRYNHRTRQVHNVMVWPEASAAIAARDMKYRFQWTFPIHFSPHDSNVLYTAGNHVFRSTDGGNSWQPISPDLTRNDHSKMEVSGGPVTLDGTNAEYYCTVFALAESTVQAGLLWAGTDDGLVHISRDDGGSWENVTPPDLPPWALISIIEASLHDPSTAYLAATRYKLDDEAPYMYRTKDYGETWERIIEGVPDNHFTRVIREDPEQQGLLYAGTEYGVLVSFNDGDRWQPLQQNLPVVPIHDLEVKEDDLVVATHGRAFWIMDDLSALRQISADPTDATVRLLKPRTSHRHTPPETFGVPSKAPWGYERTGTLVVAYAQTPDDDDGVVRHYMDGGANPPNGVYVHYYLDEDTDEPVSLTFLDAAGQPIIRYRLRDDEDAPDLGLDEERGPKPKAGLNRFVWNTRYPKAQPLPKDPLTESLHPPEITGPKAPPGSYAVRLQVGDRSQTQTFEIVKDPRIESTQEDMLEQFNFLIRMRDKLTQTHTAVEQIRSVRKQVDEWAGRTSADTVADAAKDLKGKLEAIEGELAQIKANAQIDRLKYPAKLNGKITALISWATSSDEKPTEQSKEVFGMLSDQVNVQLDALKSVLDEDVAKFNALIDELAVSPLNPNL